MIKEGGDINAYLTNAINMQNQLCAFEETITKNTLINNILNDLCKCYEMVIKGIFYLTDRSFKDVMIFF